MVPPGGGAEGVEGLLERRGVEVDGVFGEVVAVMMWWQDLCKDSSSAKGR